MNVHPLFWFTKQKACTTEWHSLDTLENYKEETFYGPNQFKPGDITYNFNSEGLRCDEFTDPSELPIIFVGCSHTEGVGLPLEKVWAYVLLERIRAATGKKIPYWNLSVSGASVDTVASEIYYAHTHLKMRPKLVLSWLPAFFWRDFSFKASREFHFSPNDLSNYPAVINETLMPVFTDRYFFTNQSIRSMRLMSTVCELWGAKTLSTAVDNMEVLKEKFPQIEWVDFPKHHKETCARDGHHRGPEFHSQVADAFWQKVEPLLSELQR